MLEKKNLRKKAKEIRISLDMKKISEKIVENILNLEIYKNAQHIMLFYPLKHEVNLLSLTEKSKDKNFYLPRVDGRNLLVCPYNIGDDLVTSKFWTEEPTTKPIDTNILDIVFVPALMVDNHFHRLGYGGGFYDIFLSKNAANASKIVAIPSQLIHDKLPSESFDAKIDAIITQDKIYMQ